MLWGVVFWGVVFWGVVFLAQRVPPNDGARFSLLLFVFCLPFCAAVVTDCVRLAHLKSLFVASSFLCLSLVVENQIIYISIVLRLIF